MAKVSAKAARPLNARQRAFVDAYCGPAQGVGTEAARMAGYTGNDSVLAATAYDLLRVPHVKAAIAAATKADTTTRIAGRRERKEWLTKLVRGELVEEHIATVGTGNGFSQVERVKDKGASLKDRAKAAELLARMSGDFLDRVEHRGGEWLRGGLDKVRKKIAAGGFKHLTAEALDELLNAMAEDGAA
jgi:phage terminase small subunit